MAKDYKRRAPAKKPAPKPGMPGWAWLVVGLSIGLFAGFLFYLSKRPMPAPTAIALPTPPAHTAGKIVQPKVTGPAAPAEQKPAKPKFDFYTLLPELEVVVPKGNYTVTKPGQKGGAAASTTNTPPTPIETPGTYMLQAGSFRTYAQADRMKATLALLGVVGNIQQVKVNSDTWNRVQIGPFKDLKQLNTVRDELQKHQIDTLVLKVKG
jgi:cell division protein FtsN